MGKPKKTPSKSPGTKKKKPKKKPERPRQAEEVVSPDTDTSNGG